jgi:hypothetical protein
VSNEQPGPHFHRGVRRVNKHREVSTRQVLLTGVIGSCQAPNHWKDPWSAALLPSALSVPVWLICGKIVSRHEGCIWEIGPW